MKFLRILFSGIPIYVTRKNADGLIATWSIAAIWGLIILYLAIFNVIGWLIYAAVVLVEKL